MGMGGVEAITDGYITLLSSFACFNELLILFAYRIHLILLI